jgi:arsenite methyltransferase
LSPDTLSVPLAPPAPLDVEAAVRRRYSAASRQKADELCCPVSYDTRYLDVLPAELIERDYGCGDPSRHVRPGETVLDLGSGGGKICYIAAQVVGARGRVIGVDCNDDMLALAREYQRQIGDRLGYHNVEFHKGRIQDLALDLEVFERHLAAHPVRSAGDWLRAEEHAERLRQTQPMISSGSIDVVVSNCVLNLVRRDDRQRLFAEVFRVLRPGGRTAISDITCDRPVPDRLQRDEKLWSGCMSGAFVEEEFLEGFAAAGFHGLRIIDRQPEPWATIEGIEFRSLTVEAHKGPEGHGEEPQGTVVYRGPWKSVSDDQGHVLRRGVQTTVDRTTFEVLARPPYAESVIPLSPGDTHAAASSKTEAPSQACCGPKGCG